MRQANSGMRTVAHKSEGGNGHGDGDRLIDVRDLARRIDCCERQCWKLLASGRLPKPLRIGRSVKWRVSDVGLWIELGCPTADSFQAAKAARGRAVGVST